MAKRSLRLPGRENTIRYRANPGYVADFLEFLGFDTYKMGGFANGIDDFDNRSALNTMYATAVAEAGVAAAYVAGDNGRIDMAAGATDNGYSALSLRGLPFSGDHNPVFVCGIEVDAITTVKMEAGFTDVAAGTDAGAVNVLATPSFNAADFVGWVFDTDDTAFWQSVGVKATTGATKIESGSLAPVAATQEILAVAVQEDSAVFYRLTASGELTYTSAPMTAAITETTLLTPWLFVQARSGNARTMTVDFWGAWQRRTT